MKHLKESIRVVKSPIADCIPDSRSGNLDLDAADEEVDDPVDSYDKEYDDAVYTDDPVRVYLRELGAMPLLTKDAEIDVARRMMRGKLRVQKAISRNPTTIRKLLELYEDIKQGEVKVTSVVDIPHTDEGPRVMAAKEKDVRNKFKQVLIAYIRAERFEGSHPAVRKPRRKAGRASAQVRWQWRRQIIKVSQSMQDALLALSIIHL